MTSDEAPDAVMRAAERPSNRPAYRARIESISDHSDGVRSLFLRAVDTRLPAFLPGMFISVTIPLPGGARVRPYTIASSPEDHEPLEIVFNRVPGGGGSEWLFRRSLGDELTFTGPYGTFTLDRPPDAELIFVAENTTIAPIRPMVRRALTFPSAQPMQLLYGADRAEHLLYQSEFAGLAAAHPRFNLTTRIIAGGSALSPARPIGAEVIRRWIQGDRNRARHFYICGVGAAVLELRDLLRGAGYERRAVHYERW